MLQILYYNWYFQYIGRTPLHYAACNGNCECIEELLNSAANINSQDDDGMTPLMYAVNHEFFDCVEILLSYGADLEIRDNENRSVIDYADNEDIKERLLTAMRK